MNELPFELKLRILSHFPWFEGGWTLCKILRISFENSGQLNDLKRHLKSLQKATETKSSEVERNLREKLRHQRILRGTGNLSFGTMPMPWDRHTRVMTSAYQMLEALAQHPFEGTLSRFEADVGPQILRNDPDGLHLWQVNRLGDAIDRIRFNRDVRDVGFRVAGRVWIVHKGLLKAGKALDLGLFEGEPSPPILLFSLQFFRVEIFATEVLRKEIEPVQETTVQELFLVARYTAVDGKRRFDEERGTHCVFPDLSETAWDPSFCKVGLYNDFPLYGDGQLPIVNWTYETLPEIQF